MTFRRIHALTELALFCAFAWIMLTRLVEFAHTGSPMQFAVSTAALCALGLVADEFFGRSE